MIQIAKRLQHTNEYYFATKLAQIKQMDDTSHVKVINLGIGSPDLSPPPNAVANLCKAAQNHPTAHKYQSYHGSPQLRQAIAEYYLRHFEVSLDKNEQVLPLLGSKEGIMHLSMTYLEAGDQVLIPDPGYPAYKACANISGATSVPFDLISSNNYLPNLDQITKKDLSQVKMMWINYPNMPTGAKASKAFFDEVAHWGAEHHILICHDNPYSFILNDDPQSIIPSSGPSPWVVELLSLSKNYNMAGWRVGALIGQQGILADVIKFKSNMDSGMFLPVQLAAAAALSEGQSWFDSLNKSYRKRRNVAVALLTSLGCEVEASQAGMFVWARVPAGMSSEELSERILQEAKVFITPGHIFGDNGVSYVRISLCSSTALFAEAQARINNTLQSNKI